ncbi:MAG: effector-associated domain EAD1-containing protein [Nostocales cyanobacterium 94392]|nr:effector-associated domain EAD1-containing protein [Nostocales cyanobacterium 94392]
MQLNGEQRKRFHDALLNAFPFISSLRQMISFELDENLDAIAMGDNYSDTVFKLIKWAESEYKVEKLLTAARSSNSGNLFLLSFKEQMQGKFDENCKSEINVYSSKVKYLYHYYFRAECEHDVNELIKILGPNIKEINKIRKTRLPDIDVEMCIDLSLEEVQAAMREIEDGHVMLQTVELKYDYDR